jgi:hypothetical protein
MAECLDHNPPPQAPGHEKRDAGYELLEHDDFWKDSTVAVAPGCQEANAKLQDPQTFG